MKTIKAVKKRDLILEAAAKVISRRGYADTTLAEIGEEAGTFAGSLYYYFESKDALVEEVLNLGTTTVARRVQEHVARLPDTASAEERIRVGLAEHFDQMLQRDAFIVAYWKIIDQVPEAVRERHKSLPRAYGRFWRHLLADGQREGVVRADLDPGLVQLVLLGTSIYALQWFKPGGRLSARDLSESVADMFFNGVKPRVPRTAAPLRPSGRKAAVPRRRKAAGTVVHAAE